MEKSCGNCLFWMKVKSIKGICDKHDYGWVTSDHYPCEDWKRTRDDDKPREKIKAKDYK